MRTSMGISMGSDSFVSAQMHGESQMHREHDGFTVVRHSAELALSSSSAPALGPHRSGPLQGSIVFRDFVDRVGDPVPVIGDDGTRTPAVQLVTTALDCLVRGRTPAPDHVVVAAPAAWSGYAVEELENEIRRWGLLQNRTVTVIPDTSAALTWISLVEKLDEFSTLLLCDVGAHSLDLTLATRRGAEFGVVRSTRSTDFAGDHADRLLIRHVVALVQNANPDFDVEDPAHRVALAELAARCRIAKERLSQDTSAVVTVELPGIRRRIRVMRSEFEDVIRVSLTRAANTVARELERLAETGTPADAVVVLGGGAAVPLVTELLSTAVDVPLVVSPEPATASARGAAVVAERASLHQSGSRVMSAPGPRVKPPAAPRPIAAAASSRVLPPSASAEGPTPVVAPTSVPVRKTPRSGIRGWMVAASAAALILLGAGAAATQLIGRDDTPSATTTTTSSVEQASSAGETGQEYTVQDPAPAQPMGGGTSGRGGAGPR
ncbi:MULTISPECIES: Hsp70 family protein [unclassified Rhodococcus (in: high G+C Gram-positive bacteria)]|uniref:Hsp70 family protein n=1 Tax=unclassified Rhodococcus (in: high G+C Gram-positive bacteria) TaxID=192944 RepID=UPI0002E396C3|nr:Hsp70 family protein [Rhodococcus sp. DK17]